MTLVCGRGKALALENVPKVPTAVRAHNLHTHAISIGHLLDSARHAIIEGWPATARGKFVPRVVERRAAADALVRAFLGVLRAHVLLELVLELARTPLREAWGLSAFLAQDCELVWRKHRHPSLLSAGHLIAAHHPGEASAAAEQPWRRRHTRRACED
eukprot:CAMPEP_0119418870 /NCGR_PEP_ID=MMETSP1335-20130426/19325_1 /TAXON_ID=259385 /ORGANISM="Chrysoculter rhomboideus, Strain RCC1486" /LENGTH=157 /DNA_ID=CAMNT_0007444141 /DNA_START=308 /DNA_END=778 /DNA_ORIENTATION=+